ncbi:ribosome recycling factor [Candidatus Saccharibacteria bacterium RIFCSPHIGHO2_12_FULL_42_8]|nr:MAG: ribosome recycling factor [Candidatus Saccharibacteria bacterium RIFCSPHIGHO2_12_FULL_42_8]
MFDTKVYEDKMAAALSHFEDELKKIRTGRAHPSMLDGIFVEVYGTQLPLNQAATITAPEPQLIQVTPFDPANVEAIVAAIRGNQSLGFNPSDDGRIVRVPIPQLTEERRRQIVKQLGEKVEDCRIALRSVRQDGLKDAKTMKNDKQLSEDDFKRVEKDLDKSIAEFQSKIEEITKAKEKEILTI